MAVDGQRDDGGLLGSSGRRTSIHRSAISSGAGNSAARSPTAGPVHITVREGNPSI